ncbi:MAG: iron ABC transporter permease [Pseudomonadota bacterium]
MRSLRLSGSAWLAAGLCILPLAAVLVAAFSGGTETIAGLMDTVLPRYVGTTLLLVAIVGTATGIIGTATAWLVTMTWFPGRRWLEIALAMPLAYPAYVLAYGYTDFLDHPGWVQTTLREVMGWGPRDYWFPEIRSLGGAAAMLSFVLYPYVYLLARAAFLGQSATAYIAARSLGHRPGRAFFKVALPMARPAIAAGVLLAIMETIADFGTVSYFGVQTLTEGIFQAWRSFQDRPAAAQLALCLLSFALLLAILERAQRKNERQYGAGRRHETMPPQQLIGWRGWAATATCFLPVFFGFLLPTGLLISLAWGSGQLMLTPRYLGFLTNSLQLATVGALVTMAAALIIGFNTRLRPTPGNQLLARLSSVGYAVPGIVIGMGLFVPFARFDNALDSFMEGTFGIDTGLLITGSMWLLIIAYMVRFMAIALSTYEAGQATIHPNVDAVARTLGRGPGGLLRGVHLPILRPTVFTALLIVFVDIMKELPATMILRNVYFGDTLAVQAYQLAKDERLREAAVPSLVIGAVGLLPVILLCQTLGRRRSPGAEATGIGVQAARS